MKYQKTAKTYEEQADLLISRKMTGVRSSIIEKLSAVNYYRLSGYWHPSQDSAEGFGVAFAFRIPAEGDTPLVAES